MMSDSYLMDGHKLLWHLDRVNDWQQGKRIAPLHIDAGLSKGCNIRCVYCFGAMQGNRFTDGTASFFPREPLMRYLRDAGELGVRSMAFIGEAEPLVNPHAWEAIVVGKKSGIDISLGTNGILWNCGRAGDEALEHLSWVRFNISAASEEAYRRIHGSEDFQTALDNIRHCVARKRAANLDVTIGLQMVLIHENADQIVPLAQLGRELGVDYLVIKQCSDTVENTLGVFDRLDEYGAFDAALREAETESAPGYDVIVKWRKVTNQGKRTYCSCLGVPFLLYSSGDGRLYPCGMFFNQREEEFRMGDLTEMSFREIIESRQYQDVMARISRIDVQKECYANCRTDAVNDFLWHISHPPKHVTFI